MNSFNLTDFSKMYQKHGTTVKIIQEKSNRMQFT